MSTNNEVKRNYWKEEEEDLLKKWADKSQCFQWMHSKSRDIYQKKNTWYTIPVIIISTLTGTANFAQERFSEEQRPYANMTIGTLSIIAGIITTISQYLKVSELNEGHRVASLSWGKFYRELNTQLIKHPLDRKDPNHFMEYCKEEYNRLVEISPPIPKEIIKNFKVKFKDVTDLTKPQIGDFIEATEIYEMEEDERLEMINQINKDVVDSKKKLDRIRKQRDSKVKKFRASFFSLNGRFPTTEDIEKNIDLINDDDLEENKDNNSIQNDSPNNTSEEVEIDLDDPNHVNIDINDDNTGSPHSNVSEV